MPIGKGSVADMFELGKSVKVLDLNKDMADNSWTVALELQRPSECPECSARHVWRHSRGRMREVRHWRLPGDQWLKLRYRAERYRCGRCGITWTGRPANCLPWMRISTWALMNVIEQLSHVSFSHASRQWGIHVRTLLKCFEKTIELEPDWDLLRDGQPVRLAVDEHSFSGRKMVTLVVERVRSIPLAILPNDKKATLKAFLEKIPADIAQQIDAAATDMCSRFRSALRETLGVEPTADRFHVVRDAIRRLDEIRLVEQTIQREIKGEPVPIPKKLLAKSVEKLSAKGKKQLKELLGRYPRIALYWQYKERVRLLYDADNRSQAEQMLDTIIADLKAEPADPELHKWARTLTKWHNNILLYFDTGMTTAIAEGYNNVVKMHKRISFGFRNVDTYIKKIMLGLVPCRFYTLHTF